MDRESRDSIAAKPRVSLVMMGPLRSQIADGLNSRFQMGPQSKEKTMINKDHTASEDA